MKEMRKTILTTVALAIAAAILAGLASAGSAPTFNSHSGAFASTRAGAGADVVTDWNRTMIAGLEAANPPPPMASRIGAIVQTSVFDAVNGIERRYTSVHVDPAAPRGASRAAAAASAAYTALVALLPAQKPIFDQQLQATLAQITHDPSDPGQSVVRGLDWGKTVANDILAWRANDGINAVLPPYVAGTAPGDYQPTPPLFGPPLFRQFANMTPFALTSPSQFLPAGPPPLSSPRYAQDLSEVRALGSATSTVRTAEQTQTAVFWQVDTPAAMWNRVADDLADANGTTLTQNARLLALMNIALADATIGIWNAKNHFDAWRPVTAIRALLDPTGRRCWRLRHSRSTPPPTQASALLRRRCSPPSTETTPRSQSPRPGCRASNATSARSRRLSSRSRTPGSTPASTSASLAWTAPHSARPSVPTCSATSRFPYTDRTSAD